MVTARQLDVPADCDLFLTETGEITWICAVYPRIGRIHLSYRYQKTIYQIAVTRAQMEK